MARDLLTESGSIFVQIGDENVHRVRALMDEVFGEENLVSEICIQKTGGQETAQLANVADYLLWYAKSKSDVKYRQMYQQKALGIGSGSGQRYDRIEWATLVRGSLPDEYRTGETPLPDGSRAYRLTSLISSGVRTNTTTDWHFQGRSFHSGTTSNWKTSVEGLHRLARASRVESRRTTVSYVRYIEDFAAYPISNIWTDVAGAAGKVYVVQTSSSIVQRCLLMATDPGDLVLDPTCGSGTTAYVAEQWGRRWITIDTSRVALALARARIMGARYAAYLLSDSREGQIKEAEITRTLPSEQPTHGRIRQGFVYERVPHVTLKAIANNAEIDVIWEEFQQTLEPLRIDLNRVLKKTWEEWEIPRDVGEKWSDEAKALHVQWWEARIARQQEIDASIAARADTEFLRDRPYEDRRKVRVAGPFTVESLSPHRMLGVGANGELVDTVMEQKTGYATTQDFPSMIMDNLRTAGVQQATKSGHIQFTSLVAWPGDLVCADGRYLDRRYRTPCRNLHRSGVWHGHASRPRACRARSGRERL